MGLVYNLPHINKEILGASDGVQYWAVKRYVEGLEDAGIVEVKKLELDGKGCETFNLEIDLKDESRLPFINRKLIDKYKGKKV